MQISHVTSYHPAQGDVSRFYAKWLICSSQPGITVQTFSFCASGWCHLANIIRSINVLLLFGGYLAFGLRKIVFGHNNQFDQREKTVSITKL